MRNSKERRQKVWNPRFVLRRSVLMGKLGVFKVKYFPIRMGKIPIKMFYERRLEHLLGKSFGTSFLKSFIFKISVYTASALCQVFSVWVVCSKQEIKLLSQISYIPVGEANQQKE